ncbi:hypothetical protein CRENBAI_001863 [Crenichthys baileyi]|uniref:Uncharacterized protein n=1 Tax=Crenichthys baileyi TaxID=28760 RepID=A0AAV9R881_9TELE
MFGRDRLHGASKREMMVLKQDRYPTPLGALGLHPSKMFSKIHRIPPDQMLNPIKLRLMKRSNSSSQLLQSGFECHIGVKTCFSPSSAVKPDMVMVPFSEPHEEEEMLEDS